MSFQNVHTLSNCFNSWTSPFDDHSYSDALQIDSLAELLELREKVPVCLDLRRYNTKGKSSLMLIVRKYLCIGGIVRDVYFGATSFTEEELTVM